MAKKKEVVTVEKETPNSAKLCNLFELSSIGDIVISLMKFALPDITNGAIKVNDSYFDAKTGFTVIEAEAAGSEFTVKYNLRDGIDIKVKIKGVNNSRTFEYYEKKEEA